MSPEENKRIVANFVEVCQNRHDLAAADEIFHPDFHNHYAPEGRAIASTPGPAGSFQAFYAMLLRAFPDASMAIDEQLAERDLVATRKTLRGRAPRRTLGPAADRQPRRVGVHRHLPRQRRQAGGALDAHGLRSAARADAPAWSRTPRLTR